MLIEGSPGPAALRQGFGIALAKPMYYVYILYNSKSQNFYYSSWDGEPVVGEAEALVWVDSVQQLSNEYDRRIFELIAE
jgi:hypothetical protein